MTSFIDVNEALIQVTRRPSLFEGFNFYISMKMTLMTRTLAK
jgi:hypothetical protein